MPRLPFRLFRTLSKYRPVRVSFWAVIIFIVVVNGLVSTLGDCEVFPLSPFHIWDKTRALGYYSAHRLKRVVSPAMPCPKKTLTDMARKHHVPRKLAFAIARAESDFRPYRISRTGAMGTMQLMPDTANLLGVDDPFHILDNIDGGVRYLALLYKRYNGDFRRIAAAYNVGPGRVPRAGRYRIPATTRQYVDNVIRYSREY